jgi:hypothetical protein
MRHIARTGLVVTAGLLLYGVAAFAPIPLHSHFWTSRTLDQDLPWYFMGRAFLEGVCAAVALPLLVLLGLLARRHLGRDAWTALFPPLVFLAIPFGRGLAVLLGTRHIWAGPSSASTTIRTFDQYLYWTSFGSAASGGLVSVVFLLWIVATRKTRAAEQAIGPDGHAPR